MHADRAAIEQIVAADMARADLYFFARWMFARRKGYTWQRAAHHRTICNALMRVYRGECKRLIINIPPRYSKTELAVINFVAWCFGQNPDCEFIHTSYSATLAANNSAHVRELVRHEAYRAIFPAVQVADDSRARDHWRTTEGGVMYAAGAGGTITGFGAGKHRDGFGGCFPYGQLVETEAGPLAIGEIVTKRLPVRVWSWNQSAGRAELAPVDTFWTNPASEIVEVELEDGATFRCTPNHRLLTSSGWFEARQLAQSLDLVHGKAGFLHRLRAGFCWVGRQLHDARRVFRLGVPFCVGQAPRHAGPGFAQLDLTNDAISDTITKRERSRRFGAGEYRQGVGAVQLGAGSAFKNRKRTVPQCVLHVLGLRAPFEIAARVVCRVAVKVPRLFAGLAVPIERLKHQVRDIAHRDDAAHGKIDAGVALAIVAGFQHPQRNGSANASRVGHFVEAIRASYRKPARVSSAGHVGATFCLEVRGNHNFILSQSGAIVANCIIVDDPHKADEARSDVVRASVIDWFQTTLESRKNSPQTPIVLIMQRLHQDDLSGWLVGGGNGEAWEHVCLSAWADESQGLPLWPEKHSAVDLVRMEAASPYTFAGQYRQQPAPPEGGIFKPDALLTVDAIPAGAIEWCRGWDLGASTDGDPTDGAKLGKLPDGRLIVADLAHGQLSTDDRDALLRNTAAKDGLGVRVSLPQDPGQAGKSQILYLTRMLAGYPVHSSPETGDKVTRAEPFASQVNVGNVLMLRGPWNDALREEMRMFPNGRNDDRIDALSRAFAQLLGVVDSTPAGMIVRGL
jgi:predicted phage terminase large subunit-like protein